VDTVKYDDVVAVALGLPDTEESLSYGEPAVKRAGRFMFGLKKDGETFSIKMDWDTHDRLLEAHPDVFFKTPHYDRYPAFLVRLDRLTKRLAKELLQASWEDAANPAKGRKAR
jgi:hypothetical protein